MFFILFILILWNTNSIVYSSSVDDIKKSIQNAPLLEVDVDYNLNLHNGYNYYKIKVNEDCLIKFNYSIEKKENSTDLSYSVDELPIDISYLDNGGLEYYSDASLSRYYYLNPYNIYYISMYSFNDKSVKFKLDNIFKNITETDGNISDVITDDYCKVFKYNINNMKDLSYIEYKLTYYGEGANVDAYIFNSGLNHLIKYDQFYEGNGDDVIYMSDFEKSGYVYILIKTDKHLFDTKYSLSFSSEKINTWKDDIPKAKIETIHIERKKNYIITYFKQINNITGYQIQYSTNKKFKKAKSKKIKQDLNRGIRTVKIKSKKKIYVRVRGYYKDDDRIIYTKWTKFSKKKI